MKWLFENKGDKEKKATREAILKQALESSASLEKAAKGTMTLAEDVTISLQAKIDDYANQIDQTARLLSDALLYVDPNGLIESFNPAAEKMFGWKKRQVVGKNISMLFQFDEGTVVDSEFMEKLVDKVNDDEDNVLVACHHEEFMGHCQDGSKIYVDIGATKFVRNDKKTFYIMLIRDVTHRVQNSQMIKDLAQKNQDLLTTIDASKTGFVILEPQGVEFKVNFVNDGFIEVTGWVRKDILKFSLRDILGVDKGYWTVRRSLQEHIEARHEIQLEGPNCKDIWFDIHITPVFKDRQLSQWILVFYDTTELKRAYENLRRSENHFRAFSDASSESMLIHDYKRIMDWNDRLVMLTGYNDSELEKINPVDLVHPLEREKIIESENFHSDQSFETLFVSKSGDVKEVAINSKPIEWENAAARIAIVRDVTEYKDIETQLKTSRERYKTVVDNTIDMVVCFDAEFNITFSNQTFRDYFDVEVEDLNGFSLLEVIPESDHKKFQDYMLSITPDQHVRRGIHRIQRHDDVRWQDWIDRGIFDEEGQLIEIQSVVRDISHLMPSQDKG